MNKKKSLPLKSKIVLVILGFSLFSFGGLLFTFIKSSKIDSEHVEITEITEKVQIDILSAVIRIDELYIYGDTSVLRNISNNFNNAEDYLSLIFTKIRSDKLRKTKSRSDDFFQKYIEVRDKIKILQKLTTKDMM